MAENQEQDGNDKPQEYMPRTDPNRANDGPLIGAAEFEFDLAGPFFDQVFELLQRVQPISLSLENLNSLREEPGVYVLHMDGPPVYVGKADDSIVVRLRKHFRTLRGCQNITAEQMEFRCLYIASTWGPLDYEEKVMERLRTKRAPGWNNKGFGSNEPGVNRGKTRLKADHFYRRFPIKRDWRCDGILRGPRSAFKLLEEVKDNVPFWFKFQGYRIQRNAEEGDVRTQEEARAELLAIEIDVPQDNMQARELLLLVAQRLHGVWQATITASHMLLYKEQAATYPQMEVIWPLR